MDPQQQPIPYLSFFTGAGFLDIGFHKAGFEAVWHNECNHRFAEGFEHGMSTWGLVGAEALIQEKSPIESLDAESILASTLGADPHEIWGVIGGPPCPDFSVGGKNRGAAGDRGVLTEVFVDLILQLNPSFFVIENVPGLLKTRKHREFLDAMIAKLEATYAVDFRLLNALDVGVPQDRQRVFIVGVERDLAQARLSKTIAPELRDWFPWPRDERYHGAKTRFAWPGVGPFGGHAEAPRVTPSVLMVNHHIGDLAPGCGIANAEDVFRVYSPRIGKVDEGDDSKKSFKRLHRFRYSPTVAYGNNEVHLHPTLPRRLSVREAMRLQGVPDGYALPATMPLSHKFKMVGNGVPVGLGTAIAVSMRDFLVADQPTTEGEECQTMQADSDSSTRST